MRKTKLFLCAVGGVNSCVKKRYVFVESVGGEYLCRSHGGALNAIKKTTYFSFWALVGGAGLRIHKQALQNTCCESTNHQEETCVYSGGAINTKLKKILHCSTWGVGDGVN